MTAMNCAGPAGRKASPPHSHSLFALALVIGTVTGHSLRAAERLTETQLDAITAGGVDANAVADAWASGRSARTATSTRTIVGKSKLESVRLRQAGKGLTIAEATGERRVEYGLAASSASATGRAPSAECQATLRFSLPTMIDMVSQHSWARVGQAGCNCTTFGLAVLPK